MGELIVVLGMGLGCFGWVGWQRLRAWRARRWATTTATIRATRVEEHETLSGQIKEPEALRLRYLYEVGGRMYTSDRIFFGDHFVPAPVSYYAGYLNAGDRVTVHFNPRDPQDSVIETRAHPMLGRMTGVGLSCLGAAPFVYWLHKTDPLGGVPVPWIVAIIIVGTGYMLLRGKRS